MTLVVRLHVEVSSECTTATRVRTDLEQNRQCLVSLTSQYNESLSSNSRIS